MNKRAAHAMLKRVSGVFYMYAAAGGVDGDVSIHDLTPRFRAHAGHPLEAMAEHGE